MDITEIRENMAYDMLKNKEYKDNLLNEMELERQKNQSPEQEAARVRSMFMGFGMKPKKEN
jgi:hypothetical protein